ncbi:hypothetical protein M9H77_20544 [Catharanthus roseus]|uniref:Uncharacterized protein n=1 Tax=Catharanthus roseus TaxID=4058 RepID=A0ACC0AKV6_CATRO|nr:hypothetical protein M9H77_20544 [Catharanthus roseus]
MARIGKKTRGRQKIEMVKIKNKSNRQVTFSKRRAGLFKKANELVALSGAEVAFIVFSPGGKVFSYGHPDVETIIKRYLNRNSPNSVDQTDVERLVETHRTNTIQELNDELTHREQLLENAKQYARVINMKWKNSTNRYLLETSVNDLTGTQLRDLKLALQDLQKQVKQRKSEVQSTILNPYNLDFGFLGGGLAPYAEVNLNKVPFPMPEAPDAVFTNMLSHGSVPNNNSSGEFEYAANFLRYNFMTSAAPAAGSSVFPGFDITRMFPRSTGGASSSSTIQLPNYNLTTSGTGTGTGSGSSSSMSHGLEITPLVHPAGLMSYQVGASSTYGGFDFTHVLSRNLRVPSFASLGFDQDGYNNENATAGTSSEAANNIGG